MDNNNVTYTLEQLAQLASSGACALGVEKVDDKVCADPTNAVMMNPSKLKFNGTCEKKFSVQNTTDEDLFFALGAIGAEPGLDPIYANSEIFGEVGVNNAGFFVGDSVTSLANSPSALALQRLQKICGRMIISKLCIVRADSADPILGEDVLIERFLCTNGRCTVDRSSPICDSCPGNNNNFSTVCWNLGLVGADERNGVYLKIPAKPAEADAPIYDIRVSVAFNESSYGYGPTC